MYDADGAGGGGGGRGTAGAVAYGDTFVNSFDLEASTDPSGGKDEVD